MVPRSPGAEGWERYQSLLEPVDDEQSLEQSLEQSDLEQSEL